MIARQAVVAIAEGCTQGCQKDGESQEWWEK